MDLSNFDFLSAELTTVDSQSSDKLKPNELEGRVRQARFSFTTPAAGVAIGENVALTTLPAGARLVSAKFLHGAMGAAALADIGIFGADGTGFIDVAGTIADDPDRYAKDIDVAAAGEFVFADTVAQNYGDETAKEVHVVTTARIAAWDPAIALEGHVLYVVD